MCPGGGRDGLQAALQRLGRREFVLVAPVFGDDLAQRPDPEDQVDGVVGQDLQADRFRRSCRSVGERA